MKTFKLFVHFHKKFLFNFGCEWTQATAYEKNLDLGGKYVCVSDFTPEISTILNVGASRDAAYVGYLAQTLATDYWVLNHVNGLDYVGVTGYRRYPIFDYQSHAIPVPYAYARATDEALAALTSGVDQQLIRDVLATHDAILPKKLAFDRSVKAQYLQTQDAGIWNAFIDGLSQLAPEYSSKLSWFDDARAFNAFGPMGLTPLGAYKEYADLYFRIVAFIVRNVPNCFAVRDERARYRTDRWVGFLAERFYPFFIFANAMSTFEVNTVELFE